MNPETVEALKLAAVAEKKAEAKTSGADAETTEPRLEVSGQPRVRLSTL